MVRGLICNIAQKIINGSDKYIKLNEIKNKIFLDALAKSDARWDGKQEYYFMWPKNDFLQNE